MNLYRRVVLILNLSKCGVCLGTGVYTYIGGPSLICFVCKGYGIPADRYDRIILDILREAIAYGRITIKSSN